MASFDRRTVGDGDVIAWQAVLSDAPFDDCLEAVKQHYAEQTEWMMPAHVRRAVRDMATQREMAARDTGWAPGQAGVPRAEALPELPGPFPLPGDLKPEIRALLESVRAMLPEGSREALMPRRVAWEEQHAAYVRTRDAQPNPLYRPGGADGRYVDGPRAGRCDLCGADSGDLAQHVADYPDGSCV
jgi:hypothetical protein